MTLERRKKIGSVTTHHAVDLAFVALIADHLRAAPRQAAHFEALIREVTVQTLTRNARPSEIYSSFTHYLLIIY